MARGIIPDLHKEIAVTTNTICVLGPKGTHGHEAAMNFLERSDLGEDAFRFVDRHHDVLQRVAQGVDRFGIVAIENSRKGLVGEVIQNLIRVTDQRSLSFNIVAECRLDIENILAVPRELEDLKEISVVLSHEEALFQCSGWLGKNPWLPTQSVHSTAYAAKYVADQAKKGKMFAALASEFAGWTYGLKVQERNVQGEDENRTRFYLLSREPARRTGNDKTAIVAYIPNKPGALFELIAPIKNCGANMSSLHSISVGGNAYAFYLEFDGHQQERKVRDLLRLLRHRDITNRLIVLGSFPRWENAN